MGAARVAVPEQRQTGQNCLGGHAFEAGKHASVAQHAHIVKRRFDGGEHPANGGFDTVHGISVELLEKREGCGGGNWPRREAKEAGAGGLAPALPLSGFLLVLCGLLLCRGV